MNALRINISWHGNLSQTISHFLFHPIFLRCCCVCISASSFAKHANGRNFCVVYFGREWVYLWYAMHNNMIPTCISSAYAHIYVIRICNDGRRAARFCSCHTLLCNAQCTSASAATGIVRFRRCTAATTLSHDPHNNTHTQHTGTRCFLLIDERRAHTTTTTAASSSSSKKILYLLVLCVCVLLRASTVI